MILNILFILIGLVLLVKGGDFLVDGAVAIAQRAKLSPMVIGITVVGFGTSMPEFLVSTQAAWIGSSGIAIGNVAGSNIANIALILGATALIKPLPSTRMMMLVDVPFMLLAMVLFVSFASFGTMERWMGLIMATCLVGFISWEVSRSRKQMKAAEVVEDIQPSMPLWKAILFVLISLAAMMGGSNLLINGSSAIAMELGQQLGYSKEEMERIVGLTIVAIGTSLPELFASVMAARKGETDMAVGNIVGSVSFNILFVVGIASAITPIADAWAPFSIDYAVMCVLALALYFFLYTHRKLVRWEGAVLLLCYVAYIVKTLMI